MNEKNYTTVGDFMEILKGFDPSSQIEFSLQLNDDYYINIYGADDIFCCRGNSLGGVDVVVFLGDGYEIEKIDP